MARTYKVGEEVLVQAEDGTTFPATVVEFETTRMKLRVILDDGSAAIISLDKEFVQ